MRNLRDHGIRIDLLTFAFCVIAFCNISMSEFHLTYAECSLDVDPYKLTKGLCIVINRTGYKLVKIVVTVDAGESSYRCTRVVVDGRGKLDVQDPFVTPSDLSRLIRYGSWATVYLR